MQNIQLKSTVNGSVSQPLIGNKNRTNSHSTMGEFDRILTKLEKNMSLQSSQVTNMTSKVPEQFKAMLEIQKSIYSCHLQTEIVTKCGDAVGSTLKKLQNQSS